MVLLPPFQAHLLVVESTHDLREALLPLLEEEGYLVQGLATLEEALEAVEKESYDLILADLFAGVSRHSFTPAHLLRRRVHPIPLGLLSAQKQVREDPRKSGFAFALAWPIDVSVLLTEIAGSLRYPLGSAQQHQSRVVKRFLEAWGAQEWKSLLDLCTEEVICYPSSFFLYPMGGQVQGKLALLNLATTLRRRYQRLRMETQEVYWRPHGLAVRTNAWVAEMGKTWEMFNGATLFSFEGERICQIGILLSTQQWLTLMNKSPSIWGTGKSS